MLGPLQTQVAQLAVRAQRGPLPIRTVSAAVKHIYVYLYIYIHIYIQILSVYMHTHTYRDRDGWMDR